MSFFDLFKSQPTVPSIVSILPDVAKQEILCGRLPVLNTKRIFLKSGEQCHYIDKAIYEKKTVKKRHIRRHTGYSMPGLLRGTRINIGGGHTDIVDNVQHKPFRGILYITNKRIIFVGEENSFDKNIDELIALTPYSNCVILQYSNENYKIFVPDGNVVSKALHLIM